MGQRIAQDGPFEALHLSCHGDILKGDPVLALEKPEGGLDLAGIAALSKALGEEGKKPGLVFLSACRTGEHGAAAAFVQSLVRSGVSNAIGWDGSVNDADAIGFAETFYEELARGSSVAYAAARARGALLRSHLADPDRGRHWHLARAYSGPRGGGALCGSARPRRVFRRDAGYKEFLDLRRGRVQVASAAEFVGRRREAQRILRAFRDRERAGVLIHGLGHQGKSSLAARITNRMPGHDTVVIYERYDGLAVFEALRNALPARLQHDFDQTWREQVTRDASNLQNALLDMLEGPFCTTDPATRAKPVLLIIDDLEQILETPKPGEANTPVKANYNVALASIIAAFRDAETESRLLLTSRYTFALTDSRGDDLAALLVPVQLPPIDETQRDKQMRAAARLAGAEHAGDVADRNRAALEARIKHAANGNPGLQAILSRPMLSGDSEATIKAVEAVESYLESGEVPQDSHAAADFFTHVSLTAFKDILTPEETQQLRAATLFSLPVPQPVLAAAGEGASVKEPGRAIERLRGLGLIDLYLAADAKEELAINPLARPLVPALSGAETTHFADKAIVPLYSSWKDAEDGLPADPHGLEAARLALLGQAQPGIVNASALAGTVYLFHALHEARPALELVLVGPLGAGSRQGRPDLHLLRHGADCANGWGNRTFRRNCSSAARTSRTAILAPARCCFLPGLRGSSRPARSTRRKSCSRKPRPFLRRLGDARSRAVTMGQIADILQARGQLDEALKIRNEEELPVYERLGDVRSRAVTMGKIADILRARGQIDEALKI